MKRFPGVIFLRILTSLFICFAAARPVFAIHPLITDDTDTQGKGNTQLEINGQLGCGKETDNTTGTNVTAKSREGKVKAILSYGVIRNADLVLTMPYQWKKEEADGVTSSDVKGIADISLEVKWRFYEKEGLSFAVKPGFTFPSGNKDKDLGSGRTGYTVYFIATKEMEPLRVHMNLGYTRNENELDQRKDLWHASIAGEWRMMKDLRLVGNIGVDRNADKITRTNPAYLLGGLVYSVSKNVDVDVGFKGGLNKAEDDHSFLAGVTIRF